MQFLTKQILYVENHDVHHTVAQAQNRFDYILFTIVALLIDIICLTTELDNVCTTLYR